MSGLINVAEIFAIAIQIESNGAAFYRKAADGQQGEEEKAYLQTLAAMEDGHEQVFKAMRAALTEEQTAAGDSGGEGGLFIASIADGYRLEGSSKAAELLTGGETMEEILQTAIVLEKESIIFYLGLRDIAPAANAEQIDAIIDEEKAHIVTLARELGKKRV